MVCVLPAYCVFAVSFVFHALLNCDEYVIHWPTRLESKSEDTSRLVV